MLRKSHIFLFTAVLALILVWPGHAVSKNPPAGAVDISRYEDIPGITETEKAAIESLQAQNRTLTYGALLSTEAFINNDGVFSGYTERLCVLLSSLFGIKFSPRLYDWDALLAGLADGSIDFSGDLIPTPQRRQKYHMSDAIAERSISIFYKRGAGDINEIARRRSPRLAFLAGSVHLASFREVYSQPFELILVNNFAQAASMLKTGKIDAFINESVSDCFFVE